MQMRDVSGGLRMWKRAGGGMVLDGCVDAVNGDRRLDGVGKGIGEVGS